MQGRGTQAESSSLAGQRERISEFGASFPHSWDLEGRVLGKSPKPLYENFRGSLADIETGSA